jgi:hypothetical protein
MNPKKRPLGASIRHTTIGTTTPSPPPPHYRPPFESPLGYQEHDLARLKLRLRHRNFHHYPLEIFHRGTYVILQA